MKVRDKPTHYQLKPNPDVRIVGIEIMKLSNYENAGSTIVAFHTGRGGRYYNAGHVTFLGEKKISDFTYDLFVRFENELDIYEAIDNRPNLLEKYYECSDKEDFSFFEKLGFKIGEKIYTDGNGNPVGLTVSEADSGVGSINIDNDYNTTTCVFVKDLSDDDINIIIKSDVFDREYVLNEYAKYCGFEDYEIELMQYFDDYNETLIDGLPQFKSDGSRYGYNYGQDEFTTHDSDEDLNEKYLEIDGVFYTKN